MKFATRSLSPSRLRICLTFLLLLATSTSQSQINNHHNWQDPKGPEGDWQKLKTHLEFCHTEITRRKDLLIESGILSSHPIPDLTYAYPLQDYQNILRETLTLSSHFLDMSKEENGSFDAFASTPEDKWQWDGTQWQNVGPTYPDKFPRLSPMRLMELSLEEDLNVGYFSTNETVNAEGWKSNSMYSEFAPYNGPMEKWHLLEAPFSSWNLFTETDAIENLHLIIEKLECIARPSDQEYGPLWNTDWRNPDSPVYDRPDSTNP